MALDRSAQALIKKVLGNPELFPDDFKSWIKKQIEGLIGQSRVVDMVQPVVSAARVYSSVNVSIPNTTWTSITFNSERYDSEKMWVVDTPTRLTIKAAGLYDIVGDIVFAASVGGTYRLARILLNGLTIIAENNGSAPHATNGSVVQIVTHYQLSIGDYVELQVFQDSGGALNALASPNCSPELMLHRVT